MTSPIGWFSGLRGKLLLLVSLPTIVICVLMSISYKELKASQEKLAYATEVRAPSIFHSGRMDSDLNGTVRQLWTALILDDHAEQEKAIGRAKAHLKSFEESLKIYQSFEFGGKIGELFQPVTANWPDAESTAQNIIQLLVRHSPQDVEASKKLIIEHLRPKIITVQKALNDATTARLEVMKSENEALARDGQRLLQFMLLMSVGSIIGMMVFGLILSSRLCRFLASVAQQLSATSNEVGAGSTQLSSASQQVSAGSTQAASSLEETVASVEELSSMVKMNTENAKQAATLSQQSNDSAAKGESEMRTLIQSMQEISKSSKKIEEIINVIDDIAFQTNLLALNAAVEAARAGEQGKGFAVVAEAVRSLAQRSAVAAKDINFLIKESVTQIEQGTKVADLSGNVLREIVTSVKKVSDLNNEIASASAEQSNGISQISIAMNELDRSTQQNASAAEEAAAASEEMSSQALQLQELVRGLSEIVHGRSSHAGAATSASHKYAPHSGHHAGRHPGGSVHRKSGLVVHPGGQGPNKSASQVIPFHSDSEPQRKVGSTEGF